MILEINKWTNPCNAFNQTDWGGNEDMAIEFQFLIASFLAFTAFFLAIKLGQALYDWFFLLFLAWPMARPRKAEKISHTELFLTKWTIRLTGLFFIQLNHCNIHYIADTICLWYTPLLHHSFCYTWTLPSWRDGWADQSGGLLIRSTDHPYRGFESLSLRSSTIDPENE